MTFELVEPATLDEAVGLLDADDPGVRSIAGGTALSLMLQARIFRPTRLVSLRRLNGALRGIHVDPDGGLRIGALTSLTELERSPVVAVSEPVISRALRTLSNVRVRNLATIGGHLAHGDPHMDLPPILVTLGARVRAVSPRGERWIAVADLITGYYETSLAGDELIAEVHLPAQPAGVRAAYAKFTALSADDWPAVGVAVWIRSEAEAIAEARIAVGGATLRPARIAQAEAALNGKPADASSYAAAADAAAAAIEPLGDVRGSAPYKREMVRVHVRRALERATAPLGGTLMQQIVRPALREVSRSVPRLEGTAKVTGTLEYIHHLRLPGMLYGKIVRSSVPHAKIRSIDTTQARALEGVHAVITADDVLALVPNPYYGPAFHDQPVLAIGKVHHVGEPVAVVLASDPHVADEGADLVIVEYDELEPVFDEVRAAQPGAPIVHDELRPAGTFADLKHIQGKRGTNIALDAQVRHGDVAAGFAQADRIFEDTFTSGQVMHTPLEPMVSVAETRTGRELTIHTASQSPSFVRMEVSRMLGWPENKVRVRAAFLGGGFGAKLYIKLEALVAVCALLVRRPVRIGLTMEEQFYTITKHGTTVRMKTGVKNDGTIVARQVETYWNGGAFADIGPRVTQKSGFTAAGPYDIAHVALDSYAVYTNLPPAGAFRGFGIPQLVWAYESQADTIARALGIDPVAFRLKNVLRDGRPHATGTIMRNAKIAECIESVAAQLGWGDTFDRGHGAIRRGRGIAVGIKASISPTTSVAIVTVAADGSCTLAISTVDMGQGSDTAMAQVCAETLGIATESIAVVHSDTDTTPYDMATLGSRSTFHMGHAVRLAADDARRQLLALAAANLGAAPESLRCEDGAILTGDGRTMTFRELFVARFGMQAGNVIGTGSYEPPYAKPDMKTGQSSNVTPFWMIGAAGVEITVDTETGRIVCDRLVTAGDVGRAINPAIVERQLNGAAIMALGSSISEVMVFEHGQVVNAGLADYKIPSFLDIPPDVAAVLIEEPHPEAPYGAKGVGESGAFGVTPAIANALEDATGVRVRDMPLLPERVLRALRAAAGRPLEDA